MSQALADPANLQTCVWVSVHERLPTTDARVLIVYRPKPMGKPQVYFARYSGGMWRLIDDKSGTRLPERITHWMPAPLPPRQKRPQKRRAAQPESASAPVAPVVVPTT